MKPQRGNSVLKIGYLMQHGAPDLNIISGPQLHVVAVISGLTKLGHRVRTVAFQGGKLGWSDDLQRWFPPQFGPTRAKWFRMIESPVRRTQYELQLPFVGFFDSLRYADACTHLLKDFDILYERYGYMGHGGVLAARRLGIPIIIELNGNIVKEIDEMGVQMSPTQRHLGRWITYQTLQGANRIIVVSEALKDTLTAEFGISSAKTSVVLNGTNVDLFSQPYDKREVRVNYNIGSGPIVAFVGIFQPWHGVDLLVSSYRQVHKRFPTSELVIIGDGQGRETVIAQLEDLGLTEHVKLLGRLPQDQVAAVLSLTDVAVAPYPFDHGDIVGTPLKIIEYMAAGKAIVASTAPIHEIIADGQTGLRVKPANAEALAQGICRLLEDESLRTRLAANARVQAQNYSWHRVVERLENIIRMELSPA